MKKLNLIFAVAAVCVSHAALADCALSQCNYLDPRYQAEYAKWKAAVDGFQHCTGPIFAAYFHALNALAIMYPRFGIAYRAYQDEQNAADAAFAAANKAASDADNNAQQAAHAAFDAAARVYSAAHPGATVFDVQAYAYNAPSYIAAEKAAKAANGPDRVDTAIDAAEDQDTRSHAVAKQRFEDRILRTAEPDALEFYNLYQLKLKQQIQSCGPTPPPPPEPPRK